MKKTALFTAIAIALSGCAGGAGPNSMGSHGKESTLSDNKIEGLYLFKINTQMNTINVRSGSSVELKL